MRKYTRLDLEEREMIGQLLSQGKSLRSIALKLNRYVSTISREVRYYLEHNRPYKAWFSHCYSQVLTSTNN